MKIYTEACRILKLVRQKKGSIKSQVFSSRFPNKRQLFALVCETLKHYGSLKLILSRTSLPRKTIGFGEKEELFVALLYDYLLGQGLDSAGGIAKPVLKYKSEISREHRRFLVEKNIDSLADLISVKTDDIALPRYVRVNLLKTTVPQAVKVFKKDGWKLKPNTSSVIEDIQDLSEDEFLQDEHLYDLLVFPPGTDLHQHPLCLAGEVILQDKASCFPAHVLSPPEESVVIDCCAAPGNKTSHVASLLKNTGKIYAFDKDAKRVKSMTKLMEKAGVTNTDITCKDFLTVDQQDPQYADVEYIIVDPSCSGSGIVGRLDYLTESEKDIETRLKSLSNFQSTILQHALSFPKVKRVVYSTCSVHAQENEEVVEEVVRKVGHKFKLTKVFPDWPHRGVKGYEHAQMCLRMTPEDSLTNGFFVVCFERTNSQNALRKTSKDISLETTLDNDSSVEITVIKQALTRKEKKKLRKKLKRLQQKNSVKTEKRESTRTNGISRSGNKIYMPATHQGRDVGTIQNLPYVERSSKHCCVIECLNINKQML